MLQFCTLHVSGIPLFTTSSAMASIPAFAALGVAHRVFQIKAEARVCRVCKKTFTAASNSPTACRYHPGLFMGAENSKHYGGGPASSTTPYPSGLSTFWDCTYSHIISVSRTCTLLTWYIGCDGEEFDAPGCCFGWHKSYDDE